LRDAAQASRLSFASVAAWWFLFSIPLLLRVPEPTPRAGRGARSAAELITASLAGLLHTVRELRRYRNALLLLVAFVIYADGIGTIQRLATSYGAELGIDQGALITAILLVQFAGIPFAFLFGMLAGRIGAKASIFIGLAVYVVLTVGAYNMKTGARLLHPRVDGRHGTGRDTGAEPIALRKHDSEGAIVGVLRLLLDLRKIRGDIRTSHV
jgi:UMF1 family MFS transporter